MSTTAVLGRQRTTGPPQWLPQYRRPATKWQQVGSMVGEVGSCEAEVPSYKTPSVKEGVLSSVRNDLLLGIRLAQPDVDSYDSVPPLARVAGRRLRGPGSHGMEEGAFPAQTAAPLFSPFSKCPLSGCTAILVTSMIHIESCKGLTGF